MKNNKTTTTPEDKTHEQKLAELREAASAQKAERETIFARIDEAIATHRSLSPNNKITNAPPCGE